MDVGGFAHVYLVKSQAPIDGSMVHVLKRIAVPDKEALKGVRKEVDIMVSLSRHLSVGRQEEKSRRWGGGVLLYRS